MDEIAIYLPIRNFRILGLAVVDLFFLVGVDQFFLVVDQFLLEVGYSFRLRLLKVVLVGVALFFLEVALYLALVGVEVRLICQEVVLLQEPEKNYQRRIPFVHLEEEAEVEVHQILLTMEGLISLVVAVPFFQVVLVWVVRYLL